jgi:hypothetical protein
MSNHYSNNLPKQEAEPLEANQELRTGRAVSRGIAWWWWVWLVIAVVVFAWLLGVSW